MVSNSPIALWLLNYASLLDVQFIQLKWPEKYEIDIHDFACDLNLDNKIFHGRGSSDEKEEAIIKSFAEACEGYYLSLNKYKNSNGIALHTSLQLAQENAKSELIERDSFYCHFLTKSPFKVANIDFINHSKIKVWKKIFERLGVQFIFGEMTSPANYSSFITAAFGENCKNKWGMIIGTASSKNAQTAIEKSFIEAARAIAERIEENTPSELNLTNFIRLSHNSILDHLKLSLNREYAEEFQKTYFSNNTSTNKAADLAKIKFTNVKVDHVLLKSVPFYGIKASSPNFQEAFFGHATPENLNYSRLQEFSSRHDIGLSLQTLPHPFH